MSSVWGILSGVQDPFFLGVLAWWHVRLAVRAGIKGSRSSRQGAWEFPWRSLPLHPVGEAGRQAKCVWEGSWEGFFSSFLMRLIIMAC